MIGPGSHARANRPARPRKTTAPPRQHQVHDDPDMPVRRTVFARALRHASYILAAGGSGRVPPGPYDGAGLVTGAYMS